MQIIQEIIITQAEKDVIDNLFTLYENSFVYDEMSFGEFLGKLYDGSLSDYGYDIIIK